MVDLYEPLEQMIVARFHAIVMAARKAFER